MTRGSGWRRAGWLTVLLALGCGGREEPTPTPAPVIEAPSDAPYEVHEWGLIAGSTDLESARALTAPLTSAGGALGQLGNGGGVLHGTGGIGKPVLYFHLDEGTDSLDLGVSVRATGAHVLEHFPPGTLSDGNAALSWPSVRVTRGACRGTYPTLADAACRTSDGLCEAAETSAYESATADCVQVGEQRGGVLLYRTGPSTASLPLAVRMVDRAGRVSVNPVTPIPEGSMVRPFGWVMRITRGNTRALTRVQVATLDDRWHVELPPAGADALGADAGYAHLREALTAAGLDDAERDAFLGAWSEALFGETTTDAGPAGDGSPRAPGGSPIPPGGAGYMPPNPRAPRPRPTEGDVGLLGNLSGGGGLGFHHALGSVADALIYLVPANTVDELLPLELSPSPRGVSRVFLARIELVPLRGGLALMEVLARGGQTVDAARRVLRRQAAPLGECVTGAPPGAVTVQLRVLTTGAVERAELVGSPLDGQRSRCFLDRLRRVHFAESDAVAELSATFSVSP